MANLGKWGNRSATTNLLTTQLNALATTTMTVPSAAIANQTNLDIYADIWLHLATITGTAAGAGAFGALYVLPALDGTSYPDATGPNLRTQTNNLLCTWAIGTATQAQDVIARNVVLPPDSFKVAFDNQTGVALAAVANTVTMVTYDVDLNG